MSSAKRVLRSRYFNNVKSIDDDNDDYNDDNDDRNNVKSAKSRRKSSKLDEEFMDSDYEPPAKKKFNSRSSRNKSNLNQNENSIKISRKRSNAKDELKRTNKKHPKKKDPEEDRKIHIENDSVDKCDGPDEEGDDDDDEDDWEEVEEAKIYDPDDYQPEFSDTIQIQMSSEVKKPKKHSNDPITAMIRAKINRYRKENQTNMHKCLILLSINRLQYLNSIIEKPIVKALIQSIEDHIPRVKSKESMKKVLERLIPCFEEYFCIKLSTANRRDRDLISVIIKSFESEKIDSQFILNLISIASLRYRKIQTRLCYLVEAITLKPPDLLTSKTNLKELINQSEKKSSKKKRGKSTTRCSSLSSSAKSFNETIWIEVFDEKSKLWIPYSDNEIVEKPRELIQNRSTPITYVLAIDNDDTVTEVTARYAKDWISHAMNKRRTDSEWIEKTLEFLQKPGFSRYQDADRIEFEKLLAEIELPRTISAYKNHPLFVLAKDLLKFQALYPADAPPVGFFRDEPVYSRNCVHTLKSRETWLREARTVKLNEKPYKIVTSRFKWKKTLPGEIQEKESLEIFGEWQTQPYEPPVANNGIVPRNGYGNVDLYKPCMLPIGTVQLRLPGLLRIANKLKIDCVPAVVGFDGPCGGAHPVMDGFVVCSEFKDILIDAWNQEQQVQREKEFQNKQQRVIGNWKKLIRGLMIKNKIKMKYGVFDGEGLETGSQK